MTESLYVEELPDGPSGDYLWMFSRISGTYQVGRRTVGLSSINLEETGYKDRSGAVERAKELALDASFPRRIYPEIYLVHPDGTQELLIMEGEVPCTD